MLFVCGLTDRQNYTEIIVQCRIDYITADIAERFRIVPAGNGMSAAEIESSRLFDSLQLN